MSGTQANARIWNILDVYRGPLGTTAPVDVATPLDADFVKLGFLDEDGGLEFAMARTVTDHYAYGGNLLRTGVKAQKHTFKFWAVEDTPDVHALWNPGGTPATVSGLTTVSLTNWIPNPGAFVLHMSDGADVTERIVIPRGDVVDPPDSQKLTDDGLALMGLTITAYSDDDGVWGVKITDNPALIA